LFAPKDCLSTPKDGTYCNVNYIFPSTDGNKLVVDVDGGSGEQYWMVPPDDFINLQFVIDFTSDNLVPKLINKSNKYPYLDNPVWFSDSQNLFIGDKTVINLSSFEKTQLANLTSDILYPSFTGNNYLWFSETIDTKFQSIFDDYKRPNLVNSSLEKDSKSYGIPFIEFPIVARDFKEITKVVPIRNTNVYLIEINSGGKKDIFFTDSGGTFKKLNPNNSDSYIYVSYLPSSQQILAIRSTEDRSYGIKVSESQLVLLPESNYAQYVANIDNGPAVYKEKSILKFSDPSQSQFISNRIAVSPDEKFIVLPLTNKNNIDHSDYTLVELESGSSQKLDINFGLNYIWLK